MKERRREKEREDNKYLYRPVEANYYGDLCNSKYYIRVICYLT